MGGVFTNYNQKSNNGGFWPRRNQEPKKTPAGEITGLTPKPAESIEGAPAEIPQGAYYGPEYYANIHFTKREEKADSFDRENFLKLLDQFKDD